MERVYITGRGLVTPLGDGLAANEAALRSGKSGIVQNPEFVEKKLSSLVAGMPNYQPDTGDLIDRKLLRYSPPVALMAISAVNEALREAGLTPADLANKRVAVVGGVAGGDYRDFYNAATTYVNSDFRLRSVSPFMVPRIMPNNVVAMLSLAFGIKGESFNVSAACASGALSTLIAARLIRSGEYDMVITGGAEQVDWLWTLGFCACRALSTRYNETPALASRPFDRDRDGFVDRKSVV